MKRLIIYSILICASAVYGQETPDTTTWQIELKNGNEYLGTVISENDSIIIFNDKDLGEINIKKLLIKKMYVVNVQQIVDNEYWFENPQASRYFWGPNGYGLQTGEGYYQNVWVLFNQVSYGFSDYFTLGLGVIPLFLFGSEYSPIWITPKFSLPVKKDKVNLGAGVLAVGITGESGLFGITYGTATFGNRDRNTTIGLGYGFAEEEWTNSPLVNLSFMARVGKRGYLLSENYFIDSVFLVSFGGRVVFQKLSLDFGGFLPINADIGQFIMIPWLGFVVPF